MKRINVWRGQAPRGIRTVNTTGFGGIVLVPTILMVLLLGAVLIACPEAGSSGGSQATVETIARANNGITAKWQASAGASGYIVTVTNEKGDVVVRKSVASVTDKNDYELDIDQLPKGTHKVSISTKENPDAAIATSKEISISTEPIVAVYKAHVSADNSAHRDKFSLGDYNDPGLLKIAGLKDGSKPRYEITVKMTTTGGSASTHSVPKTQITVPSSGTIYVGLAMDAAKWRDITDDSEVTITLTVYDDAGTTEFFSETVTPKKSPDGSIYSWRGLQNMQDKLDGTYTLENDIVFPDPDTKGFKNFTPVGSADEDGKRFTGTLDGNNKKVSELYIDHDAKYAGLFGYVKAKTKTTVVVKDLTLEDPQVTSTKEAVGPLVGLLNTGTVSNVHVQGGRITQVSVGVVKHPNTGGLVGAVDSNGVVSSSSSSAQVIGADNTGGLVGQNNGTVRGYATGTVSGNVGVGGLVGINYSTGTVTGYATGAVSASNSVGGLVGQNSGTVRGYATGTVSGNDNVGGLVGYNLGTVTGYATGAVSGKQGAGGLVGYNLAGTVRGYALGYVIKKTSTATDVGPGIGKPLGGTENVYVGRTGPGTNSEVAAEKDNAGAGDHVGVIATTKPDSATKSNGAAPQGIVIEGSGRNVAADATKTPPIVAVLYSKNEDSFSLFDFGTAEGEWTLGANNWPILNFASDFASGARTQNPSIPAKPENFHE